MTYDELYHDIIQILPGATFNDDKYGQLIIYTDKMFADDNRTLVDFNASAVHKSRRCQEGNHKDCPDEGVEMAWDEETRTVVDCGCSCHKKNKMEKCPLHNKPWVEGLHNGRRRCEFYVPELGVSEDYGCPQPDED